MLKYFLGCCILALSSFSFAEPQTWYFVRHFEKQLGDDPSLTETGHARAKALAAFFSDKSLTQVFSTEYNRTLETATSVSALKNLSIEYYDPENLFEFANKLKTLNHILVVGHSNSTPQIMSLMGGEDINIEETDYGVVYMLQKLDFEMTTHIIHIPLN
ncbi:MAG: phosphohistidine phosphatase SixA [Paraglaciecola sp.]|jgi:phosphohistidine phosphatase SixA